MPLHIGLAFAPADVTGRAGRRAGARAALERGLVVAGERGHLVAIERARRELAEL